MHFEIQVYKASGRGRAGAREEKDEWENKHESLISYAFGNTDTYRERRDKMQITIGNKSMMYKFGPWRHKSDPGHSRAESPILIPPPRDSRNPTIKFLGFYDSPFSDTQQHTAADFSPLKVSSSRLRFSLCTLQLKSMKSVLISLKMRHVFQ